MKTFTWTSQDTVSLLYSRFPEANRATRPSCRYRPLLKFCGEQAFQGENFAASALAVRCLCQHTCIPAQLPIMKREQPCRTIRSAWRQARSVAHLPGPTYNHPLGFVEILSSKEPHRMLLNLAERYGPIYKFRVIHFQVNPLCAWLPLACLTKDSMQNQNTQDCS